MKGMDEGEHGAGAAKGGATSGTQGQKPGVGKRRIKVLVLDLWCYTPYYDRYLCEVLRQEDLEVRLAAGSYYKDPGYFKRQGCDNDPGPFDMVARLKVANQRVRRTMMFLESCINMLGLSVGFIVSRPDVIHVQWIPIVKALPIELWFLRFARYLGVKLVYTVHNVLPQ